jgi:ketosteroid isomerase-like protein
MMTKSLKDELLGLEKKYWQAIKNKDIDTAMQLTDDPCIVAGATGVARIDRQKFTEMMNGAKYTLNDFRIGDDAQMRMLGDEVALLAYNVHEELTVEGKRVTIDASDASTWVLRNGRWVCALHTESLKGDPYGRDRISAGARA